MMEKNIKMSSTQELIKEINCFVSGATYGGNVNSVELPKSAIFLLKTLPPAREAVLEHLYNVFDEAVNDYLLKLELEGSGTDNITVSGSDESIQDIHSVLSHFIIHNPESWAPVISTWSLDLLGQLSGKYAGRRGVPHASSLNEVLQLWMTCRATRTLIDITTQCVSTLIATDPDMCIDALLETSVQHSPHFDWVVAHIGSCFPTTIITRVLACGLKDFCSHEGIRSDPSAMLATEKKVPKLASVVGILGHLAGQHSEDIRQSLLSLFKSSFTSDPSLQQLSTVPFLLQLASMSNMLLQVITTDFVTTLDVNILNQLCEQIPRWRPSILPDLEGLIGLVVRLILRSEGGGTQVINFLLDTTAGDLQNSEKILPKVQSTCGLILDTLLLEIQHLVYTSCPPDVPLLQCLQQNISTLCNSFLQGRSTKAEWILPLLIFAGVHGGERFTCAALEIIMVKAKNSSQLYYVLCIQGAVESCQSEILNLTVNNLLNESLSQQISDNCILNNLTQILYWDCLSKLQVRSKLIYALRKNLNKLVMHLVSPNVNIVHSVMNIFTFDIIPNNIPVNVLINLCRVVVKHFFEILNVKEVAIRLHKLSICKKVVFQLCSHSNAQKQILRLLLEGILGIKYSLKFGSKPFIQKNAVYQINSYASLLTENQKHAVTITLPQSHSTVFHAGVIGQGLRNLPKHQHISKEDVVINCQCLIEILQTACNPSDYLNDSGATSLSLLMVELISSDVMFNGLPWPEEDCLKVTVERDLHIKRMFEDHPVLWNILYILADMRPALCYCSVLLRGLTAVILSFWASCQEKMATNCPKQLELTCKIVNVMAIGQLIPPPLSHTDELFPKLTPYEVFVILSDIWKYMKENVPTPTLFSSKNTKGYVWRDFDTLCDKKFTFHLHHILQNNISRFGEVYYRFFSVD